MGRLSELFKNMDEVKAYAEEMKKVLSVDEYEEFAHILGLLENRAISESLQLNGQTVKIDRYLAPMILDLNARGIVTIASCSGLREEHPEEKFRPASGYLAIAYGEDLEQFLKRNLDGQAITVKEAECYLKPSVLIEVNWQGDAEQKAKWDMLWKVLRGWNPEPQDET